MASDLSCTQNSGDRTVPADPIGPGDKHRLTLLRAAVAGRPLNEVASLVELLNQAGGTPSPGDEAMRWAAVSRPVEEVHQLVTLMEEPPHTADADTALRAAATGRPVEEVAALISIFGRRVDGRQERKRGTAVSGPTTGTPLSAGPAEVTAPETTTPEVTAPETTAPETTAEAGPPSQERRASSSLRSALRWPAAAALLVIVAVHLPTGIAGLRSGDIAASASTVIAACCLLLVWLLAVMDTAWVWGAAAAAAVGTAVAHSVTAGSGSVHLLQASLGSMFPGATGLVMSCAVIAAVLAGAALTRRQRMRTRSRSA